MKIDFKKLFPYLIAVTVFLAICLVYFAPVLSGKGIKQGDIVNYTGASKEIKDFREKHGEEPLWTNAMFGGMPAYQISTVYYGNLLKYIDQAFGLWLPHPINLLFICMLGFYILLIVIEIDIWLAIAGAIAFGFSSYLFIIIEAGHNSKAHAIGYMAPTIAAFILTFRGKYLLGGALTALFLGLELYCNHLQITYYLFLILLVFVIVEGYKIIKSKNYRHLIKASGVLAIAAILAIGPNIGNLWNTYSYGKETIRGKSELTDNADNKTSGLDKDYATSWSYGVGETMTLLVPNFKGGGSEVIGNDQGALKNVDPQMKQTVAQMDRYFGDQPFTSGPVYVGAIVVFLFVLGLFIIRSNFKWAIVIITIVSITLAWGKNFMPLTDFMLEYFPGYNKFRAVSMILVIAELSIPLLAIMALNSLLDRKMINSNYKLPFMKKEVSGMNIMWISFAITGGLSLLFYLIPSAFNTFIKPDEYNQLINMFKRGGYEADDNQLAQVVNELIPQIEVARTSIFKADAIRSFFMIGLAFVVIWMYLKSKIDKISAIVVVSLLLLIDMWPVNKRYLNDKNFVSKAEVKNPFTLSKADAYILEDKSPDYRVLNIAVNTFNNASTSYFHKSIGGYHGAKLRRYQDIIDSYLQNSLQAIMYTLRSNPSDSALRQTFFKQQVLNMLNTKYIIYDQDAAPLQNRHAFGNAWFANEYKYVANADSEITALSKVNLRRMAVVDEKFKPELESFTPAIDSAAFIRLTDYKPNHLSYSSKAATEQLAVFSEIYFADGWNAYIDGKAVPHFRANYILRAMRLPAGEHQVEFKFEPSQYYMSEKIAYASSCLLFLFVAGVGFMSWKRTKAEVNP